MNGTVEIKTPPTGPDAPAAPAAATPERPAWLPEKFKTPEDMAKSYAELESKLGKPAPVTPPAAETKTAETKTPANPLEVPKPEAPKPISDLSKYEAEFAKDGKLSDGSYAELEKAGYAKTVVDNYIAGQAARGEQLKNEVFNSVGGQEQYTKMVQAAASILTPAEQQAYNNAMTSGDIHTAKLAAAGLAAKFQQQYGKDPKLAGGSAAAAGPKPYDSWNAVTKDMGSKQYKESPSFRAEVQARLAASQI